MKPLAASAMKDHAPQHPFPPSGHNSSVFDQEAMASVQGGLYLRQRDAMIAAVRDPRLSQRHRVVLAAIIEHTNVHDGAAYPGYKALAKAATYFEQGAEQAYSEAGIRKTVSELSSFGYIASARKAPAYGGRALAHYAVRSPESLRLQIQLYIAEQRRLTNAPDVTPRGNVTSPLDVTSRSNIRSSDVTPGISADVTPVAATVTSIGTSSKRGDAPFGALPPKMSSAEMAAALNPDAAFAFRNIKFSPSGKLTIGEDFRRELAATYTDSQIERALERAPRQLASVRDPMRVLAQIRWCASYAKQDDDKNAAHGVRRANSQPDPLAGLSAEQRARVLEARNGGKN